jgi:hypothetical protein
VKHRELLQKQAEDEKVLKSHHKRVVGIESKSRKMDAAIYEAKKRPRHDADEPLPPSITEDDLTRLREKLTAEEAEKK